MIRIVGARICHIIQDLFTRKTVSISDRQQTHRPKSSLGVYVQTLALATAHVKGQLTGDCEGMANLGFTGTEFAKELRNTASFDTAGQERVEILGASGDGDELGAALVDLGGGGETHRYELGCCGIDKVRAGIALGTQHRRLMGIIPSSRILLALAVEMPLISSRFR